MRNLGGRNQMKIGSNEPVSFFLELMSHLTHDANLRGGEIAFVNLDESNEQYFYPRLKIAISNQVDGSDSSVISLLKEIEAQLLSSRDQLSSNAEYKNCGVILMDSTLCHKALAKHKELTGSEPDLLRDVVIPEILRRA